MERNADGPRLAARRSRDLQWRMTVGGERQNLALHAGQMAHRLAQTFCEMNPLVLTGLRDRRRSVDTEHGKERSSTRTPQTKGRGAVVSNPKHVGPLGGPPSEPWHRAPDRYRDLLPEIVAFHRIVGVSTHGRKLNNSWKNLRIMQINWNNS